MKVIWSMIFVVSSRETLTSFVNVHLICCDPSFAYVYAQSKKKKRSNYMSLCMRKPTLLDPTRSDKNRSVLSQNKARSLKLREIVLSEWRKQRR